MRLLLITALLAINSFAQITDSPLFNQSAVDTVIIDSTYSLSKDSLVALNISELADNSFIISRESIIKSNYRFAGDLLNDFPLSFQRDYGFIGYPNEVLMYGIGNPFINWMSDGIPLKSSFSQSYNLNLVQTEDIDSIEIVPLPRGFLSGSYMYPVTVNFITRDFIPTKPYSRIRYIQGLDREASVDASFNALVSKKFLFSFDITNRIKDSTFSNSEFGIWQVKTKLKYFLSDKINLIASYRYNDYKIGFNGGVNVDSIAKITNDINSVLYDNLLAPVNRPNDELSTLQHFPMLSIISNFFSWLKSDLNFYYRFSKISQREAIIDLTEEKVTGVSFRNKMTVKNFEFNLSVDYENQKQFSRLNQNIFNKQNFSDNYKVLSVGGLINTRLLHDKMNIALFYKYSNVNENIGGIYVMDDNGINVNLRSYKNSSSNSGSGADFSYKFDDNLKFYIGSSFLDVYSVSSNTSESILFQSGISYSNSFLNANISYIINGYVNQTYHYYNQADKLSGWALSLKAKFYFLLLETQNSLFTASSGKIIYSIPEFISRTGIYFKDYLFNDNLDLKAGFIFTYFGEQNYNSVSTQINKVPAVSRLDFSLAGEIQKAAIVYFIWENLFDKKYYLTPYYPMPFRNIRFGVAWEFLN